MGAGLRIDHVLYAVRDLDEAASRLATEWGLATSDGGRHPGHGTANRIVPLGSDYIELIAIVDQLLKHLPHLAYTASQHDGSLPLHFAASLGNISVAQILLQNVSRLITNC